MRAAGAACLKAYVDTAKYPKFLRPERTEPRKCVIRCMRDELKDLKAGDVNLSDEEGDYRTSTTCNGTVFPSHHVGERRGCPEHEQALRSSHDPILLRTTPRCRR